MKKDDVIVEENTEKKVEQTKPFFVGLAIILISLISILLFPPWFLIIIPLVTSIVVWFIWAPSMIVGIFIPEGYSVIICRGQENGSFVKAMANYKGYNVDENGKVVDDNVKKWLPGIKFFWWPFDRVYSYNLEWKQYSQNEKVVHRKEHLYYVLLKIYAYLIEIDDAEDKDKVPQNLRVVVPMQIVDVYKAAFKVQNWYRIVSNVIISDLRDFIRTKSYEELISSSNQNLNEMIGNRIKLLAPGILKNYGVNIFWDRVAVVQIATADEEYSRATLRMIIALKNAEAIKVEAGAEAFKRSTETMGLALSMLARFVGEAEGDLSKLFRERPEDFERMYGKKFAECLDLVQRAMALEKGKFVDIRSPDAKGGTSDLLSIIMASRLISDGSGGGTKTTNTEKSGKSENKGKIFDEKTKDFLRKAGLPVDLEDEV